MSCVWKVLFDGGLVLEGLVLRANMLLMPVPGISWPINGAFNGPKSINCVCTHVALFARAHLIARKEPMPPVRIGG